MTILLLCGTAALAVIVLMVLSGGRSRQLMRTPLSDAEILENEKMVALNKEMLAAAAADRRRVAAENSLRWQFGPISPQIICSQCQTRGTVRTKPAEKKVGISGGKATAALLTGGFSMLATGLSRKESYTQAHCGNCDSTWSF